jgi:isoquinoline 1-oxidoreductase
MGDTDLCPYDKGTVGSRSMADAGPLLRRAAAAARSSLAERPLAPGERRVELASNRPAAMPERNELPVRRREALDVVSGAMRYPGDLTRPGMLHGWVLKPPTPDARLRDCDLEAAQAIDGVTVVHDGGFIGVTAADPEKIARAKQLLRAEWTSPAGPDESELSPYLRSHPLELEGWGGSFDHEVGEVEQALGAAAIRLEATYSTAYVAHVPLETRAALAEWDGERLTVWTGTQRPFGVRAELAAQLDLPEARVRVIAPTAGAGFGGKHSGEAAVEAARLSRATGRPVKVHWSRGEEFGAAYVRPAAVIDIRSGADFDGRLSAWDFLNVGSGAAGIGCPYVIPNQTIKFQPADSPLRHGSYRALAATANHFARESHIDELAHAVGIDPLELRLTHSSFGLRTSRMDGSRTCCAPPPSGRDGDRTMAVASPMATWGSRADWRRRLVLRHASKCASTAQSPGSRGSSPPSTAAPSSSRQPDQPDRGCDGDGVGRCALRAGSLCPGPPAHALAC